MAPSCLDQLVLQIGNTLVRLRNPIAPRAELVNRDPSELKRKYTNKYTFGGSLCLNLLDIASSQGWNFESDQNTKSCLI